MLDCEAYLSDDGGSVSYQLPGRKKALTALPPKGGLKDFCDSAGTGLIRNAGINPGVAGESMHMIRPFEAGSFLRKIEIDPGSAGRRWDRIDPTKSGVNRKLRRIDPTNAGEMRINPMKAGVTDTIQQIDPTKAGSSFERSYEPRSAGVAREMKDGLKLIQKYINGDMSPSKSEMLKKFQEKYPDEFDRLIKAAGKQ